MHDIHTPISPGELIDKITILRIKAVRISEPSKLANVRVELELLEAVLSDAVPQEAPIPELTAELQSVNETLWQIEDDIRECDRAGDFGPLFLELARAVYRTNDRRADLKKR
ncbi:MAG: hypothetical protein AAGD12_04645, partial [Pseudomonadota bacterium]